jgi:hypothetical protein
MEINIMRWFVLLSLLVVSCFSVSAQQWTPFTLHNGHVKMPVKVADIETYALLDSGAQINAINKAFVSKHDLKFAQGDRINLQGVFGTEIVAQLNNVPVELFGTEFDLDNLAPVSLGHHSTGLILGAGFFSSFVVQIDYPNSRIRFIPRKAANVKKFENIKMTSQKGTGEPLVKISINKEKPFWVLLDTGNSGGLFIDRFFAESLGLTEQVVESSVTAGANRLGVTESTRVEELQFGPYTLENVLVSMPAYGQGANVSGRPDLPTGSRIKAKRQRGILGYDVLQHFVLTLDYKSGHGHIGLPEE